MSNGNSDAQERHWNRTFRLTMFVLSVWFFFAFVVHWFANDLNELSFLGFPVGYYMAVQGSLAAFVVLIFFQNWMQDRIDDELGPGDQE